MQRHTLIELKLDTHKGLIKAYLCTNFVWYPIKIYGVMIDFSLKIRLKRSVMPTKVNCWKESDETWHVGGVAIVGVPFCDLKGIRKKDHGDMTRNPISVKIMQSNL